MELECSVLWRVGSMRLRLDQRKCTAQVGAGRSGVAQPGRGCRARESEDRVCLASTFEHGRWLPQVPSPAQAAIVGWLTLWCIRDSPVDQLTLCTTVLLRLGVKRFQGVMANSVELISAHRRSDRHWASLALAVSLCVGSSWEKACCSAWLGSRASVARNNQRTC